MCSFAPGSPNSPPLWSEEGDTYVWGKMGVFSQFRYGKQLSWELGTIEWCLILRSLFFFLNKFQFWGSRSITWEWISVQYWVITPCEEQDPTDNPLHRCHSYKLIKTQSAGPPSICFSCVHELKNLHLGIPLLVEFGGISAGLGELLETAVLPEEIDTGRHHCAILSLA